jgi:hypothetical protein
LKSSIVWWVLLAQTIRRFLIKRNNRQIFWCFLWLYLIGCYSQFITGSIQIIIHIFFLRHWFKTVKL